MLMISFVYKQWLFKILLFSLLFFGGPVSLSYKHFIELLTMFHTSNAPKYYNIQIWKFKLQKYWKQRAYISTRAALIFGCDFATAIMLSPNDGDSFVHWALMCGFQAGNALNMYASDITAPFASNNVQYHFHWCCQWPFVFLSLFTGHVNSSSSSSSTNMELMMWNSEYNTRIINTALQCILTSKA